MRATAWRAGLSVSLFLGVDRGGQAGRVGQWKVGGCTSTALPLPLPILAAFVNCSTPEQPNPNFPSPWLPPNTPPSSNTSPPTRHPRSPILVPPLKREARRASYDGLVNTFSGPLWPALEEEVEWEDRKVDGVRVRTYERKEDKHVKKEAVMLG